MMISTCRHEEVQVHSPPLQRGSAGNRPEHVSRDCSTQAGTRLATSVLWPDKGRTKRMDDGRTDQMDDIGILRARDPDKEIVGLNVTIYERLVMDRLNSGNLMCKQKTQNKR